MLGQILELVPYLVAALLALAFSWRRPSRVSGFALVAYSIVSGLAYFTLPFGAVVVTEITLATFMATIASILWAEGTAPRSHQVVMAMALIDTAWCALTCYRNDTSVYAQTLFGYGANVLFLGMCAAITAPGAMDVVRGWFRPVDSKRGDDRATSHSRSTEGR